VNAPQGFQTSSSRLAIELGLIVVALVVLGVVGWFGVGYAAHALVRSLPPESERTLGKTAWTSLAPESERCTNKRTLQYVGDVLRPLLAHQPPGYRFEYAVADNDELNAYALPGGYITVNMGLLEQIERSEELAGVLAHELAHVTERHGTSRMAAQLGLMAVVQWAMGGTDLSQVAQLAAGLVSTAYARDQEADADTVGLQTLAAARVDPLGMAELFDRLANANVAMPELISTHPDPGKRAERARAATPGGELRPLPALPEGLACH
jgi:predicted Zn-dependent protease